MTIKKGEIFYGLEPPSEGSTTTECGFNYQWGAPSCSRPQPATDSGIRDSRYNWLVTPPPYTGQYPWAPHIAQFNAGCKSQDLLHSVSHERATFGCQADALPVWPFRVLSHIYLELKCIVYDTSTSTASRCLYVHTHISRIVACRVSCQMVNSLKANNQCLKFLNLHKFSWFFIDKYITNTKLNNFLQFDKRIECPQNVENSK